MFNNLFASFPAVLMIVLQLPGIAENCSLDKTKEYRYIADYVRVYQYK